MFSVLHITVAAKIMIDRHSVRFRISLIVSPAIALSLGGCTTAWYQKPAPEAEHNLLVEYFGVVGFGKCHD